MASAAAAAPADDHVKPPPSQSLGEGSGTGSTGGEETVEHGKRPHEQHQAEHAAGRSAARRRLDVEGAGGAQTTFAVPKLFIRSRRPPSRPAPATTALTTLAAVAVDSVRAEAEAEPTPTPTPTPSPSPSPPSSVLSSGNVGVVVRDDDVAAAHQPVPPEPERAVIIDLELDPVCLPSEPDSAPPPPPTDHRPGASAAESSSQAGTPPPVNNNVDDAAALAHHHQQHQHQQRQQVFTSAFGAGAKKQPRLRDAVRKALQLQAAATQAFLQEIAKEAHRADAAEKRANEMAQRAAAAEQRVGEMAQRAAAAEHRASEMAQRAAAAEQRAHRLASEIGRCRSEAQRMANDLENAVHEAADGGCGGSRALHHQVQVVQYGGEPKLGRPGSSTRPGNNLSPPLALQMAAGELDRSRLELGSLKILELLR